MNGRAISLSLMAALTALLLSATAAAAATGPASRVTPPSIEQEIGEQGTNGFYLTVKVHDRHRLELSASRIGRDLAISGASYEMPYRARPGSNEIKARFGKLGRVDMRFVAEKVKHPDLPESCRGGEIVEEEGFWVGVLAFHGESGFTRVRVHSALGTVLKMPPLRCRPEKAPDLKKLKRALEALEKAAGEAKDEEVEAEEEEADEEPRPFVLVATARDRRVALVASRESFGRGKGRSSGSNLVVLASRRRGRIEETGAVVDTFAPGSYVKPSDSREPDLETILKPPDPFSGSATYRDPPRRPPTWTGDLRVALPGFGTVRLAGGGTRAAVCESLFEPKCKRGFRAHSDSLIERLARR